MGKRKQTCFRDEIRKSLIFHALAPCVFSLVVLVLIFTVLGSRQIIEKSKGMLKEFSQEFQVVLAGYVKENRDIAEQVDIDLFLESPPYQTEAVSRIYRFLNGQEYRGDYYLFDRDKKVAFSTENQRNVIQYIGNYLSWNMAESLSGKRDVVFIYDNTSMGDKALPAWFIFRTVVKEGRIAGYSGFVLRADQFKERLGSQELTVLMTNKYNRVFTEGAYLFRNDRGKLVEEFRGEKNLVHYDKRWYYSVMEHILEGEAGVWAIYDCTSFIQLCVMSLVIVVFLTVVTAIAIYRSTGTVADKKTEILYDLIGALDQVEKGVLDVSLDINTGDEFERIGKSFNTMLGSIRHLLERHKELARENMQATVQVLESQFNPHFLFNTLESVRYMIKFEPQAAEKMIVSLSRMLRYSIQNGKEVVSLSEEMDFVDRYLQVMLIRYGGRLKYRIEMEEGSGSVSIPRMTLQPIVENAVKYGFGEDRDLLEITVETVVRKDRLAVVIKDDGVGIGEELLECLKENLKQSQNLMDHIGLYNVNKRISLVYGNDYGLDIRSRKDLGTTVIFHIPYDEGL